MQMVETDESTVRNTRYLGNLNEDHIRAAHIFNSTVDRVRQNFAIAGLLSEIQVPKRLKFMFSKIIYARMHFIFLIFYNSPFSLRVLMAYIFSML